MEEDHQQARLWRHLWYRHYRMSRSREIRSPSLEEASLVTALSRMPSITIWGKNGEQGPAFRLDASSSLMREERLLPDCDSTRQMTQLNAIRPITSWRVQSMAAQLIR